MLIGLLVAGWWGWESAASRRLRGELARIRAAGEPLTIADLEATASAGEVGDDAAPDYAAALALLHPPERKIAALARALRAATRACPPAPVDPVLDERARRIVARERPALELLDRAATKRRCTYTLASERSSDLRSVQTAARLVTLRTLDLAVLGDGQRGAASAATGLALLRVLDGDPTLARYAARLDEAAAIAERDVPAVLSLARPAGQPLAALDAALALADRPDLLRRAILGERVAGLRYWAALLGRAWPAERPPTTDVVRTPFWTRPWVESLAASYLDRMAVLARAAREPWPQVLAAMPAGPVPPASFDQPSRPDDAGRITRATGRTLALLRAATVAVHVEQYRRVHGETPATLIGSDRETIDPRTGEPFVYRPDPDWYVVEGGTGDEGVRVCTASAG